MITIEELKKLNDEHFKENPRALRFCLNCKLDKKIYCDNCADKMIKRLEKMHSLMIN